MATTTRDSALTTAAVSTTGTLKRTVQDKVRNLFPGAAKLLALVSVGEVEAGELKQQPGMIGKKMTENIKVEGFTYTPLAITYTVTTLSSTTLTLTSSVGLCAHMTVVNTRNNTCARVDSYTSSTVVEVTSFGGTAFSASAGDVLLAMGPAYPENSSSPNYIMKDDDNFYNYVQNFRYPTTMSVEAANGANYGGNLWERQKKKTMIEGNRRTENTLFFSERASSGDTTSGGAALTSSFRTTRGCYQWAANSYNAGGSMTPERFRYDVVNAMSDVVNDSAKVIMFCGNAIFAQMLEWVNQKLMITQNGTLEKFGVKSTVFTTHRFDVEVVRHDSFNRGSYAQRAMLMVPEEWTYYYFKDEDFSIKKNIQSPSTWGMEDEVRGIVGLCPMDAGQSTLTVTDWNV